MPLIKLCRVGEAWRNRYGLLVWKDTCSEKPAVLAENPISATLTTKNPKQAGKSLRPGLPNYWPATNCLSHGTVLAVYYWLIQSDTTLPLSQALQPTVDLDFQYYLPTFLPVSGHCTPISYSHCLQILFNFTSPSFHLSSSFTCSFHSGSRYFFALFRYSSFQYVHSIII